MKKTLLHATWMAIFFLFNISVGQMVAQANWTFMVYLDADNDLEPYGILDFNEMEEVGSTNNVNIIVQMDRLPGYDVTNGNWTGARRYRITKDNNTDEISSTLIEDLGEVNMGHPETLESFITWTTTNYPATNYALVLWDHGGGWEKKKSTFETRRLSVDPLTQPVKDGLKNPPFNTLPASEPLLINDITGTKEFPVTLQNLFHNTLNPSNVLKNVCVDQTSGDFLSNAEVTAAITAAGNHIQLIGFDACLMAMIENAYPLRDLGDYLVGSEETIPGDGWPYDQILTELINTPAMTPAVLAQTIVNEYAQFYNAEDATTQSAIDLNLISDVATKLDAFTQAITTNNTLWDELDQLRLEVDKYTVPEHKDLWHIASRMEDLSSDAAVDLAAANLKTAITNCVIQNYAHTPDLANSKGVAIYFPAATDYKPQYGEASNGIDFMVDHQWDNFLISYFNGGSGGTGTDDPDINYGTDKFEPNNNFALAYGSLENNKDYNGYLIDTSDIDIFRIEVPVTCTISIDLDVPADFDLYLLQPVDNNFEILAESEEYGDVSENISGRIFPGVYYLAVTTYETHQDAYTVKISGLSQATGPVTYETTLAYDYGEPQDYIWGTSLGDAAACMYSPPSIPAQLTKIWLNIQDLDAGGLGGDGTFYLYAEDFYGSLFADTVMKLTPPTTGWVYVDLESENIFVYGEFLVAIMYDGVNTPGIGYDNTVSFGNNLFFSDEYDDGFIEAEGTYYIRAEIKYIVSNSVTTTETTMLDPAVALSVFPNPFTSEIQIQYESEHSDEITITVSDINGRVVYKNTMQNPPGNHTYQINADNFSPGMYLLQIKGNEGTMQKKLIKK